MKVKIYDVATIGQLARAVRKQQSIRQDDLGSMIDCSHKFIGDVEKGKRTVECGRVLRLLEELGIEVYLDVPSEVYDAVSQTKAPRRKD
ncbi:helix-turn-helix transcriptional regulator [Motiliproteus sp. SC1-56]|uniref:helix-turn-helix transcriptional regulator n=1 Tax=Motiliproteus sp. SC1-56 TaxID=2799565 RepID=UPI001A8F2CC2|nr:helix-turn-helix transcriptional regulator [Motiliproteus sp. SC1-56]